MRCLYCGKELALLKRLRGGGDFCSDAHKQSYQEEYNRLALSRLLQAQKKGQPANNSPTQSAAPPPHASVDLEEPDNAADRVTSRAANVPALEVALTEARTHAMPEAAIHRVAVEKSSAGAVVHAETSLGAQPAPSEAGFLFESPALAAGPELIPYLETWLELSGGPAMSEWQIQNGAFSLSSADLLSLDLRPTASSIEDLAFSGDLSPQAFASAHPDPTLSSVAIAKKIANTNRLRTSSVIAIDIAPSSVASNADESFVQAIGFEGTVLFNDSQLLELSPTAIDFPAEDSGVVLLVRSHSSETEPEAPARDDSPLASLAALSRLHQELVEQETALDEATTPVQPSVEPVEALVEVVQAVVVQPIAVEVVGKPEEVSEQSVEPGPEIVELTAEAQEPKCATELFEISIKTFPPAKPALIGGDALPTNIAPLLPHLKSLPLRPKIALATGYVPPSTASAPSETKPATPAAVPTHSPSKALAGGKPSARLIQPKQPLQPAKPVQAAAKAPKAVAKPVASQPTPFQEASAARPNLPEVAPKIPLGEKEQASKSAPAADQPKKAADQPKPAADQPKKDNVPSFSTAQPANISWLGSLKVKLGIAILLLVIACVYFLGWGSAKPGKPAGSNPAVSTDGSGPSIMMGEGGWVEGWGGDPSGMHAGRQITIYRPSLKLSDYRLEFQGSIDTKSIGWVFRASDPDNYYAMKLMTVSSGLATKVALFKYLVANGKQTQVGRVPIELAVQPDTVFDVRVDVRGAQFTTYIQGQQVDSWTDDQLKTGGAGFLNERDERGKVKSVSIRYLSGAVK
jgi:hypothetical protein